MLKFTESIHAIHFGLEAGIRIDQSINSDQKLLIQFISFGVMHVVSFHAYIN